MTKLLVSCALAAMTFAVAPEALKADDELCPLRNATLRGTYMAIGGGTAVGVGPVSAVGTITYDGTGNNSVNTFTVSVNGVISRGVTVTGPYTVNSDCTGTLTQSDGTNYDFVVAPDGRNVNWIETDTGTVVSGTELRLNHTGVLSESNRDAVQVPRGGAATPESLATTRGGPLFPYCRSPKLCPALKSTDCTHSSTVPTENSISAKKVKHGSRGERITRVVGS